MAGRGSFRVGQLFLTFALTAGLAGVCLWISTVDFRERRIPDMASLPLVAAGLLVSGFVSGVPLADRLIGAGAGFLLLWAMGEAYFRARGAEALGIGDAKLFGAAGAWLGWSALPTVLLIAAVMGLVYAALRPKARADGLAFGPWLCAGFLIVWLHVVW